MVSFDVVGLFTNVPLDHTIKIILKRIYDDNEIKTDIPRTEMKLLLEMCTKNVHFTFNDQLYTQIDGVAMGSPLGPVIAGIFMVELETEQVPKMEEIKIWKRYVDDTFCITKKGKSESILKTLNKNKHIKFTCEKQSNNMLAFLDVLLVNRFGTLDTTVYRKPTHTDIYINWNSYAPETWKRGTLKMAVKRAFTICNQKYFLYAELEYLETVFSEINGYPIQLIKRTINECRKEQTPQPEPTENEKPEVSTIVLPYAGVQGELISKDINKTLRKVLDNKIKGRIAFRSKKLKTCFQVKDRTEKKH